MADHTSLARMLVKLTLFGCAVLLTACGTAPGPSSNPGYKGATPWNIS